MANTIKLKRSAVQGKTPQTTDLELGEIALNTYDGKMFIKKDDGTPSIVEIGGGSSVPLYRYAVATNPMTWVLATGPGVDVTMSGNTATMTAPAGVQVVSASVHFMATDIGVNTAAFINYGSNQGTGDNSTYELMFPPQYQVWNDVPGGRAMRTTAAGNLNTGPSVLQITGLAQNMAIYVNLSF